MLKNTSTTTRVLLIITVLFLILMPIGNAMADSFLDFIDMGRMYTHEKEGWSVHRLVDMDEDTSIYILIDKTGNPITMDAVYSKFEYGWHRAETGEWLIMREDPSEQKEEVK